MCAVLLVWSGIASATVYKWVDAQGKVQYGDSPPDGVNAEVVEMPGSHATPAAAERPAAASAKAPATDDGAKKSVESDVAQSREKQCTEAQDRYKKLIETRKLYKTGPDGERQYLSSDEIDAERLAAKQDVDQICNSPT
jgi:hypothetical protein